MMREKKSFLTDDQVGQITSFLTKITDGELQLGKLSVQKVATSLDLSLQDLANYLRIVRDKDATGEFFSGTQCPKPKCTGVLLYHDRDFSRGRVELHCSLCQDVFYRSIFG